MTFQLKQLGQYRVEGSEEFIPKGDNNSYAEIIRVRGSSPEPLLFTIPSHLYKYSETELGLYLKDRKNAWDKLGKVLGIQIDRSNDELMLHFPIEKFQSVASIITFVKKRGQMNLSEEEKAKRVKRLFNSSHTPSKMSKTESNSKGNPPSNIIIPERKNFLNSY